MELKPISPEYRGWWRIIETSMWMKEDLDMLGPALISFTGNGDRLRMLVLLAHLKCRQTKLGVSFTWKGAWEWDQMTGTGRVKLTQDGRLNGVIKIKYGDESTFIAERAIAPDEPIQSPPRYQDKWRQRW